MLRMALVVSAVAVTALANPITYSVAVIPFPSGVWTLSDGTSVNDSGQVAGSVVNGADIQSYRAFIGMPAGSNMIPLPPGWNNASGFAINGAGQVAGDGNNGATGSQAFIGTTAGSTPIPFPSGVWTGASATAVNDLGQVAGAVSNGLGVQAFIGTTAGSTVIPLPAGWSDSGAYAVNDSGSVVGSVFNLGGPGVQAYIGTTAGSTVIPLPVGWSESFGYAVNNSGQVAGEVSNGFISQAFIGTASGITLIPLPNGATTANVSFGALNDLGTVVGHSDAGIWMWNAADGTVLLNNLLGPQGWSLTSDVSISDNGLIVSGASCNGGPVQTVELSAQRGPVSCAPLVTPEPGTYVLSGAGLLLLLFARRTELR